MSEPGGSRQRYAAGLPSVGRVALPDEDRDWVRRRLRRLRLALALGGAATGLTLGGAFALERLAPGIAARFGGPLGVWLATLGLAGAAAALAWGTRPWKIGAGLGVLYLAGLAAVGALVPELTGAASPVTRAILAVLVAVGVGFVALGTARRIALLLRSGRVRRDLEEGEVERYAGEAEGSMATELRRLARRGYVTPRGSEPVELDVLPRSGVVTRVSGRRCTTWHRVHRAEVALPQPHALRVGLPRGVAPSASSARLTLQRRSLSPDEQLELEHHVRRLRRWPIGAFVVTVAMTAAAAWQVLGGGVERLLGPMMFGWYGLAVVTVAAYVRRMLAARRLDQDRRLRWVVTVGDGEGSEDALSPPRLEVLPVSQLAWTENATPSRWRASRL